MPARDPFFEQLAQLAAQERTRAKWIFLPYTNLKWTLGERLLHAGQNWANFRFVTPFDVALEVAAPNLLARGIQPTPEALGPSLLHRLLVALPRQVEPYFRPLLKQPGMADALWSTLKEVRMAGIGWRQLEKVLTGAKGSELTALFQAYEDYLASHRWADRAGVFQEALVQGRCEAVQAGDLIVEYPSAMWSPLERSFLDVLEGCRKATAVPDLSPPRRVRLLNPQRQIDSAARPEARLSFFRAGRRDAEIMEILRRIKDNPLDQIEIASADPEAVPLLRDKLALLELPVTFEMGLPIALSKPGQALLGLLGWIEQGYSAFDLRELLLSDLLVPGAGKLAPATAAGFLERAQATWGRETYSRCLGALRTRLLQKAAAHADEAQREATLAQAEQVAELGEWVAGLLRRLPNDGQDRVDWEKWVRGVRTILEEDIPAPSPTDQSARRRLLRALDELLLLEGQRWSVEETLRSLRQRLGSLEFGGSRALPGHLHVTTLDRLGVTGRPHLYVLGLEEGRLATGEIEDPVVSDAERAALHPGLALSSDRPQEALFRVQERLAVLEGHLTLSYSVRDLRSGQELLPSWLYFRAARQVVPLDSYEALARWLGEPVAYAPDRSSLFQCAGESDWWLAQGPPPPRGGNEGLGAKDAPGVLSLFPDLAAGQRAEAERASEVFTIFDGWVPSAAGKLDPRQTGSPISVSRLESLAACPFRFFLENGLRLQALELARPDPDRWLSPADRGHVLHEVYAIYHRDLRSRGWKPDCDRDQGRIMNILDQELERMSQTLPSPSEAVSRAETRALRRDLEKFLRLECQDSERAPLAFEVGFGLPELDGEPLARAEPVLLELGEDMRWPLRGRIDRIDRLPDGLEVVDYKTGRSLSSNRGARYAGGRLLQHALYSLVVEQLAAHLGPVRGASYYFPTQYAQQERISMSPPDRGSLRRLLVDMFEPLKSGAFVHSESELQDCKYCNLRAACRSRGPGPAALKLANPSNTQLDFRRSCREVL